jgi:hypothetical protein
VLYGILAVVCQVWPNDHFGIGADQKKILVINPEGVHKLKEVKSLFIFINIKYSFKRVLLESVELNL